METAIIITFVLGYLCITLEHRLNINKAATALLTGVLCWTLYAFSSSDTHHVSERVSNGTKLRVGGTASSPSNRLERKRTPGTASLPSIEGENHPQALSSCHSRQYPHHRLGRGSRGMGMEKIDFFWYLKRISWLALLGYFAGAAVYMFI